MTACAGGALDLHTHYMADDLPDLAGRTGDGRWPRLEVRSYEVGDIMCGADQFRRVARPCWDIGSRLARMDADGVAVQVISPVPVSLTYWAPAKLADELARHQNDGLAEAVSSSGGRMLALGTVALQDTDLALEELRRAVDVLGLSGLEIGTRVGDEELDAPRLRPFFAEAARRRLPIFVHPTDGEGAIRTSTPVSAFGLGMLADTAIAAHALVYGGVLAELPELRICLSHGGGAYSLAHARMRYLAGVLAGEERSARSAELDALAGLLWADALVFDPVQLDASASVFGRDHLVVGSDFPFVDYGAATAAVTGAPSSDGVGAAGGLAVASANGAEFLGIDTADRPAGWSQPKKPEGELWNEPS